MSRAIRGSCRRWLRAGDVCIEDVCVPRACSSINALCATAGGRAGTCQVGREQRHALAHVHPTALTIYSPVTARRLIVVLFSPRPLP